MKTKFTLPLGKEEKCFGDKTFGNKDNIYNF